MSIIPFASCSIPPFTHSLTLSFSLLYLYDSLWTSFFFFSFFLTFLYNNILITNAFLLCLNNKRACFISVMLFIQLVAMLLLIIICWVQERYHARVYESSHYHKIHRLPGTVVQHVRNPRRGSQVHLLHVELIYVSKVFYLSVF